MAQRSKRQFNALYTDILSGNSTQSPGAITTGTQATFTIAVPGVSVGDPAFPVATSAYIGALDIWALVSAADTVSVFISNTSGGSLTPPASTIYYVAVAKTDTGLYA